MCATCLHILVPKFLESWGFHVFPDLALANLVENRNQNSGFEGKDKQNEIEPNPV